MALPNPWALLATAMAILVGLAAVVLTHRIARPLRTLGRITGLIGDAAGQGRVIPVPEVGPDETRAIARALNGMQGRIRDLVTERTQALAAVSHDLRTPIARLRLRLDGVADDGQRRAMASDLDDMQAMIDSTLAYLRGDADPEVRRVTNVASLLMSIADAGQDAGRAVVYEGPGRALAAIRPVALRRALDNVVDNAVRYGERARIGLAITDATLALQVDDDGPGPAARRGRAGLRAVHPPGNLPQPQHRRDRPRPDHRPPGDRGRGRAHRPGDPRRRRPAGADHPAAPGRLRWDSRRQGSAG
jgi:signal transduction histidine kinase